MENFIPIADLSNYYEASKEGNIRRVGKDRLMVGKVSCWGYRLITIHYEGKQRMVSAHRIIAKLFIPNPYNKEQVNHKNGNKLDNRADNLEWVTRSENELHSYRVLKKKPSITMKGRFGLLNPAAKSVYQYSMDGVFIKKWDTMQMAWDAGFQRKSLYFVLNGRHKHHKGFLWSRKPPPDI